jgi:hypothetical protein
MRKATSEVTCLCQHRALSQRTVTRLDPSPAGSALSCKALPRRAPIGGAETHALEGRVARREHEPPTPVWAGFRAGWTLGLLAAERGPGYAFGTLNAQKGDGDAATWLPPNKAIRCLYVARQVAVKCAYNLWVTAPEKTAITTVLSTCPGQPLPTSAQWATPPR